MRPLFSRFELGLCYDRFSRALRRDAVDFELEGVQHDVVGRLVDDDGYLHSTLKRELLEIGRQMNLVAFGSYVFWEPVVLNRICERRAILIEHRDLFLGI